MSYDFQHALHVIDYRLWLAGWGVLLRRRPPSRDDYRYLDGEEEKKGIWR